MVGYYRRFIPSFSSIAAPLSSLTKKDRLFEWTEEQESAFQSLKAKLSEAPVLCHYDPNAKTILQTDASFFGWGFIISQISAEDGLEHPIAIESGQFTGAQLNYTTTKKEFLAIVEAFIRAWHMLLQVNTTVLTDHHNLKYWMVPRQLTPRQARWMEILSGFRFKIIYRPGKLAVMPDALSRRADYHPGKGETNDIELNNIQALPDFGEQNKGLTTETLRALQSSTSELSPVSISDLVSALPLDEIVAPLRSELLLLALRSDDHSECRDLQPVQSLVDLR